MTDLGRPAATSDPPRNQAGSTGRTRARYDESRPGVLELVGEYDISTVHHLRAALDDRPPNTHGQLVVDLTHVTFLDAHCAGLLLRAAASTQIVVVGATGNVACVLDVLDPDQHLPRTART